MDQTEPSPPPFHLPLRGNPGIPGEGVPSPSVDTGSHAKRTHHNARRTHPKPRPRTASVDSPVRPRDAPDETNPPPLELRVLPRRSLGFFDGVLPPVQLHLPLERFDEVDLEVARHQQDPAEHVGQFLADAGLAVREELVELAAV